MVVLSEYEMENLKAAVWAGLWVVAMVGVKGSGEVELLGYGKVVWKVDEKAVEKVEMKGASQVDYWAYV
jgi:hypothetical protein